MAAMRWPLEGVVQPGSDSASLVVQEMSPLMHVGMRVILARSRDEKSITHVRHVDTSRSVLVLESELPFHPVGWVYRVSARELPHDVSAWIPVDVVSQVQFYTNLHQRELALSEGETTAFRRRMLSTGTITLHRESTIQELESAFADRTQLLQQILQRGLELEVFGDRSEEQLVMFKQWRGVMLKYATAYESLRADIVHRQHLLLDNTDGPGGSDVFSNPYGYSVVANAEEGGPSSALPEIMEFFLGQARRQNIRKKGDFVYEEVYTQTEVWVPPSSNPRCRHDGCSQKAGFGYVNEPNKRLYCYTHRRACADLVDLRRDPNGQFWPNERLTTSCGTRAWRPRMMLNGRPMTIAMWISETLSPLLHKELWVKWVAGYQSFFVAVSNYLQRCPERDPCFPTVLPDQSYFSFRNGIYDTHSNVFHEFGNRGALPQVCAINYIHQMFNEKWTWLPLGDPEMRVPGYATIIASQSYDQQMQDFLDCFLGRLFYPVKKHDSWEKLLVIKGWAATGKSTIARAVTLLLGDVNVGYVPVNCEEQWALASVHDKTVWMCLELKAGFKLQTGVMQSMTSGEATTIHKKHETAFDKLWTSQGLCVGNEIPTSWMADVNNALARRVLPFPFDLSPSTQDPTVGPLFLANLGKFLARITRMYRQKVAEIGNAPIDSCLPKRLLAAKDDFKRRTQPVLRFLEECEELTVAPLTIRAAILRHLASTEGIGHDQLNVTPEGLAALPHPPADQIEPFDMQALLARWRVSMKDMSAHFKTWNEMNNGGRRVLFTVPDIYRPAAKEVCLAVVRGVHIHGKAQASEYWYGVCLKNALVSDALDPDQ